jgi:hypothetical protein
MPKPFSELRARFVLKGFYQQDIAKKINCCNTVMTKKLYGERPFTMPEVYKMCELLDIADKEIPLYFPRKEMTSLMKKEA